MYISRFLILSCLFFLSIDIGFLSNCFAQEIVVNSNPDQAEIYLQVEGKKSLLGKTPFKMTISELGSFTQGQDVFNLVLVKEGFHREKFFISNMGGDNIQLSSDLKPKYSSEYSKSIDKLISELFEAQRLVRAKKYDDALAVLNALEKKHQDYSAVYELKGGVLYLTQQLKKALSYYRKAFDVNPQNRDAYKMKAYLEGLLKSSGSNAAGAKL